ncbi:MAG TPA: hypothetical protein VK932_18375 [Kofleriaceae bacterium]|nr:hypothetical protein [Kofleriaceae bacterium]
MGSARKLLIAAVAVAAAVLAPGSAAHAQAPRAGAPTPGEAAGSRLAIDLATTGNLSRGLVYRDLITNRGVLQAWSGPWGIYLQPYWLYSRVGTAAGRVTADNDIYVRLGMFRNLTRSVFVTAVNVYDHNLRRRVAHRDLFGAGAGANLVQQKPVLIATSVAVLGEVTDFDGERLLIDGEPGPDTTATRKTARWAVRLHGRYRLGGGRLSLVHDLIVMPSFRDPANDYRINFSGTIDAPIAKGFAARVQAEGTREGVIVEGTTRDALVVTFGVSYRAEWQRTPPAPAPAPPAP